MVDEKRIHSVVGTFDGAAKVGKTRLMNTIVEEAIHQAGIYEKDVSSMLIEPDVWGISKSCAEDLSRYVYKNTFDEIRAVSAGNAYRAASLLFLTQHKDGHSKTSFNEDDIPAIQEMLQQDGIRDVLQNDPTIVKNVSTVAKFPGLQYICGALFSNEVTDAYNANGGSNLVLADARDPVGILKRHGKVGAGIGLIEPASIIPVYVETPVVIAAMRAPGAFDDELQNITSRRLDDATRKEFPVVKPTALISGSVSPWRAQFYEPKLGGEIATPYLFDNGETTELDHVQWFAGYLALLAQDTGILLDYALREGSNA